MEAQFFCNIKIKENSNVYYGEDENPIYVTYKYDKNNNITSEKIKVDNNYTTDKTKNVYKDGLLVKCKGGRDIYKISYKKITVSKKDAANIKRQQWYYLNGFY